jgi:hypothetical protein
MVFVFSRGRAKNHTWGIEKKPLKRKKDLKLLFWRLSCMNSIIGRFYTIVVGLLFVRKKQPMQYAQSFVCFWHIFTS